MKRLVLALLLLAWAAPVLAPPANAQSPVSVIGPVIPGDCAEFNSNTVLKDAGITCSGGGGGSSSIPNVSGSGQSTTATCVTSNTTVALAAPIDFINGQGIALENCGTTFSGSAPTALAVTASASGAGPTGSTHYTYTIACVDNDGGVGIAVTPVTITNGNASLGAVTVASALYAFNRVTWTTTCAGVAVWKEIGAAGFHLMGVFGSQGIGPQPNIFDDVGNPPVTIPWIPDTPTAAALNDRLVTTVFSGAGSSSIVVSAAPSNPTSGSIARHDDTAALLTYMNANPSIVFPSGTYNIENTTIPTNVAAVRGMGPAATIIQSWSGTGFAVTVSTPPNGFLMDHLAIVPLAGGNVFGLKVNAATACRLFDLALSGVTALYLQTTTGCVITHSHFLNWYLDAIGDLGGSLDIIASNNMDYGLQPSRGTGVFITSNSEDVHDNIATGGDFIFYELFNANNNLIHNNVVYQSLHEVYHIAASSSKNIISNNIAYGIGVSIDFCISMSDDGQPSALISDNRIIGNALFNCGSSAIGIVTGGGSAPNIINNVVTGNIMSGSNEIGNVNTPDILISGTGVTETIVNANTFLSGSSRVNYNVVDGSGSTSTQVGTVFGVAGLSGTTNLTGVSSTKLTGGTTGLP